MKPGPAAGERHWAGPLWSRLVIGGLLVALGASLVLRPFASLAVLVILLVAAMAVAGVGELVGRDPGPARWRRVRGAAYLAGALVMLAWPAATIRVIAVTVAATLLVEGLADVILARGLGGTARLNAGLAAAASIVLGLLALAWPDVSVLVVAVTFGARVLITGGRQVVAFVKGDDLPLLSRRTRPAARGGRLGLTGTVLGAALAAALALVSLVLHAGTPVPDAFYEPPAMLPAEPGMLLRSEPYDSPEIPAGANAWRILYTTTRDEGVPALGSGLVIAPAADGAAPTPRRVVAWAHGTTGFANGCAPSILPDGLAAGAMTVQDQVVERGWTMVATDYVGLGTEGAHPYLIGQGEARSVLDAIRAAGQLKEAAVAAGTVVWGHSQGGHAALWTGVLAPSYAPELRIEGVAALAPASDLPGLIDSLGTVTGGELFASYVLAGYTAAYPDVRAGDVVRPGARILAEEMGSRCLSERATLVSLLTALTLDKNIWSGNPDTGAFGSRLRENVPAGPIAAPLLVAQGAADTLVEPAVQAAYVRGRCEAGQPVDYRTYPGRGHVQLVEPDSPAVPDLLSWTAARFEGAPARSNC